MPRTPETNPTPVMLPRPRSIQELKRIQEEIRAIAEPFVRIKCDILAYTLPRMTVYSNGDTFTWYDSETEWELAAYDAECKREIRSHIARNYPDLLAVLEY